MSGIRPQALTNNELVKYAELGFGDTTPLPEEWKQELLKRFAELVADTSADRKPKDPRQQDLFPTA